MDLLSDEFAPSVTDPLDAVEQAVIAEQYPYDRDEMGELHLTASGAWRDHQIWFAWREELEALHICASLDLKVPSNKFRDVCELVARLNEKLWLGHFDVWFEDGSIVYRHALSLPNGETVSPAQAAAEADAAARVAAQAAHGRSRASLWVQHGSRTQRRRPRADHVARPIMEVEHELAPLGDAAARHLDPGEDRDRGGDRVQLLHHSCLEVGGDGGILDGTPYLAMVHGPFAKPGTRMPGIYEMMKTHGCVGYVHTLDAEALARMRPRGCLRLKI